jgi:exodeoxyribonuclease V alpha subunit
VALLTPYRKKTETGVNALNELLREKLNPPIPGKPQAVYGRSVFRSGDKVMQIRNRDDVNNGDVGYITDIVERDGDTVVRVDFGDGRMAEYEQQDLELLELAYACTVHKSQGSEYRSVIVNIQTAHYIMLKRPLIYTAITRAKQRVAIVGEKKALRIAIKKTDAEKRGTMLAARICEDKATAVNQ